VLVAVLWGVDEMSHARCSSPLHFGQVKSSSCDVPVRAKLVQTWTISAATLNCAGVRSIWVPSIAIGCP
jgi:hypothetical protein